jgi:hypothetical protein
MTDIQTYVGMLHGYLSAMRDMNDNHSSTRYWFSAQLVSIGDGTVNSSIEKNCGNSKIEILEIDLKNELEIIESYILRNYMQGTSNPDSKGQNYIKNLHGWRIQEYISLAANYDDEDGRWVVESETKDSKQSDIFIKINNDLVVLRFAVTEIEKST